MMQLKRLTQPLQRAKRSPLMYAIPLSMLMVGVALMRPAPAQDSPGRILSITGRGAESAPTSATRVSLGVEVNAETAEEAQAEAARRSSRVVDLLKSKTVDLLQTAGITLNPRYDYSNNQRRLLGYTATNTVSFEVETERAGPLLDELVQSGATTINGISFIASDEAIAIAQRQALREAVQDAQEQATVVLDALGLQMQDVAGIQVNGARTPPPVPFPAARAEAMVSNDASTPVIGQEQEVNASVTLQIRY